VLDFLVRVQVGDLDVFVRGVYHDVNVANRPGDAIHRASKGVNAGAAMVSRVHKMPMNRPRSVPAMAGTLDLLQKQERQFAFRGLWMLSAQAPADQTGCQLLGIQHHAHVLSRR